MPTVTVTGRITVDGHEVPGFPVSHTVTVAALQPFEGLTIPADGNYHPLPVGELTTTATTLLVQATVAVAIQVGSFVFDQIVLQPGGTVLLHDYAIIIQPLTATVRVIGSVPALVSGFIGGT